MLGCLISLILRLHIVLDPPIDGPGIQHPIVALNYVRLRSPPSLSSQPASLPFVVWQFAALTRASGHHRVQRKLCRSRKLWIADPPLGLVYLSLDPLDNLVNVRRHNLPYLILTQVRVVDPNPQSIDLSLELPHLRLCIIPRLHLRVEVRRDILRVRTLLVLGQEVDCVLECHLVVVVLDHRLFKC